MRRSLYPPMALVALLLAAIEPAAGQVTAYTGFTLWDGTGAPAVEGATMVVDAGRIVSVGADPVPAGAAIVDLSGTWVVPGLINTHGHVEGRWAPASATDPEARLDGDLRLYVSYGVTTVNSLGNGGGRAMVEQAVALRDAQAVPGLDRARLYVAGPVIAAGTPEEGRAAVDENASFGVDWIKFRVDDNLGATAKMTPPVYRAIIERAHERGLRVATHLFYLEDAVGLMEAGTDMVAHSVRDTTVSDGLVDLLRDRGVCYVPTLTRELSTFVYADRPDFFDDPFFDQEAVASQVASVSAPEHRTRIRSSRTAPLYREALGVAQQNLRLLAEAGVAVAMGTDSGPLGRFPGYFEHLELQLMAEAGLSPEEILRSATGVAADCLGLSDVGTLQPGRWADFLVLNANPLADISATESLARVYVAGNRIR